MASEDTLIGNDLVLAIGDGNSPELFTDFCAIAEVNGLGESKPLVEVTALCDDAKKFRNGLKEGSEMTVVANLIQGDAQTRALFQNYQNDDIVNFRYRMKDVSPEEYFAFSATIMGWAVSATSGAKASMTFTIKITGVVDWVYT